MKSTAWTTATENPIVAITALMSALEKQDRRVWLEIQKNGEQDFPITEENPMLQDIRNWTMSYGVPSKPTQEELNRMGEMERKLTVEYTACYGEQKAIDIYYETGQITKGLLKGMGKCFAMKKEDLLKHREDLQKDGWSVESFWTTHWKPAHGVAYRTPKAIDKVLVVCMDYDLPQDRNDTIDSAILLLQQFKNK